MHTYQTEIVWRHERECRVSARDNPELTVATPPEFGGPEGVWSPEELFVASVGSCLLSTFLYFAYRFGLAFGSYSSTSTGRMEKTSQDSDLVQRRGQFTAVSACQFGVIRQELKDVDHDFPRRLAKLLSVIADELQTGFQGFFVLTDRG